jgi:hypothetical protein
MVEFQWCTSLEGYKEIVVYHRCSRLERYKEMVVYQLRNIPERYGGMVVYQGLNRQEGCQKISGTSGAAFKRIRICLSARGAADRRGIQR